MRATLRINLATADRLVAEGERMIVRHRAIAEALENEAHGSSETILRARNVLTSIEVLQARRIANRDQLRRATLQIDLASAERVVAEGERTIARQRDIAEALGNEAGVSSGASVRAWNVFNSIEALHSRQIANREQLRRLLAEPQ